MWNQLPGSCPSSDAPNGRHEAPHSPCNVTLAVGQRGVFCSDEPRSLTSRTRLPPQAHSTHVYNLTAALSVRDVLPASPLDFVAYLSVVVMVQDSEVAPL